VGAAHNPRQPPAQVIADVRFHDYFSLQGADASRLEIIFFIPESTRIRASSNGFLFLAHMTYAQKFVAASTEFADWVMNANDVGMDSVENAIGHINVLQSLVLDYGFEKTEDINFDNISLQVSGEEWQEAMKQLARMPLQYYSEIFDPLTVPADEPVVGDITDDIADIYRDTVSSLRLFESGDEKAAIDNWIFNYWIHWGEHATGALRTLYCYRREHL